jgi:hypothetical protein
MRINARLIWSFADREPGCGHKTENSKEDEEHGECRGHMFITQVYFQVKDHSVNASCPKSREIGYVLANICTI